MEFSGHKTHALLIELIHHSIEEVIRELAEKNGQKIIVLVEYSYLEICFRVTTVFLTLYF